MPTNGPPPEEAERPEAPRFIVGDAGFEQSIFASPPDPDYTVSEDMRLINRSNLEKGDIIVLFIDPKYITEPFYKKLLREAIMPNMARVFPENSVMCIPNNCSIEIVGEKIKEKLTEDTWGLWNDREDNKTETS